MLLRVVSDNILNLYPIIANNMHCIRPPSNFIDWNIADQDIDPSNLNLSVLACLIRKNSFKQILSEIWSLERVKSQLNMFVNYRLQLWIENCQAVYNIQRKTVFRKELKCLLLKTGNAN